MTRQEAYELAATLERRNSRLQCIAKENPRYVANNWTVEITVTISEPVAPDRILNDLVRLPP